MLKSRFQGDCIVENTWKELGCYLRMDVHSVKAENLLPSDGVERRGDLWT